MLTFYSSKAYKLWEREETKLWHTSPEQVFAKYLTSILEKRKCYQNSPGNSKLAPYAEQIKMWQVKGMTLRKIAAELQAYGCKTTAQNLSRFLRRR